MKEVYRRRGVREGKQWRGEVGEERLSGGDEEDGPMDGWRGEREERKRVRVTRSGDRAE
ncbi:MAG: hypothetical protein R2734_00050 [Nocardioides sp.]